MNESVQCTGRFTRDMAVIDYILVNETAEKFVSSMLIDEKKQHTELSDHNLMLIQMTIPKQTRSKPLVITTLDARKAARVMEDQLLADGPPNMGGPDAGFDRLLVHEIQADLPPSY